MTTIEWTETTDKGPGWEHGTASFLVGCCSYSSRKSGHQTSWSLRCRNEGCRWDVSFPYRPSTAQVEQLVADHMAECGSAD